MELCVCHYNPKDRVLKLLQVLAFLVLPLEPYLVGSLERLSQKFKQNTNANGNMDMQVPNFSH